MPKFVLSLDSKNRSVRLNCAWETILPFANATDPVASADEILARQQKDLSDSIAVLEKNIQKDQRAGVEPKDEPEPLKNMRATKKAKEEEQVVVQQKLGALKRVGILGLKGLPIPFRIAMNVDSHRLVLVESESTNGEPTQ